MDADILLRLRRARELHAQALEQAGALAAQRPFESRACSAVTRQIRELNARSWELLREARQMLREEQGRRRYGCPPGWGKPR